MQKTERYGIFLALFSAVLYALSTPFSKILLESVPSTMMAGLLYIGAGIGMGLIAFLRRKTDRKAEDGKFTKKEFPYVLGMIILDIAAPICLMFGLGMTSAANASLLNNFEYAATALIAFFIFGEKTSGRLLAGISMTVIACMLLSFEGSASFDFSKGSVLVLLSAVLWGIENNCTRAISEKDPMIIVILKGVFCGGTSFLLAILMGERTENISAIVLRFFSERFPTDSVFLFLCMPKDISAQQEQAFIPRQRLLLRRCFHL